MSKTTIKKPLLAGSFDPDKADFSKGLMITPKVDGLRFLKINGVIVSRSLKPIRNKHIQAVLSAALPDGVDGEITSGDTFQSCGKIMKIEGEPDFKVWLFDFVDPDKEIIAPYQERLEDLKQIQVDESINCEFLIPKVVHNLDEVYEAHQQYLIDGFEGSMVRQPDSTYKFGRSTTREAILLKIKDFADDEAIVIGFTELERNLNEAKTNALGHTERSTSKEGKVLADTLGSFIVDYNGVQFNIGSGLNDELRETIWQNKEAYLNKIVKFKHQPAGAKAETGVPRLPIFLGFRDEDDL